MKIQELQHPSLKSQANKLLDQLRHKAQVEAEQMMDQYVKDLAVNPNIMHPSQIIDQELDALLHAFK